MNLDRMFLKKSMGMRLKEINTNMFVNQFMTNVLREQPKFETRNIMREYFRVNDQDEKQKKETNQFAVIEAE